MQKGELEPDWSALDGIVYYKSKIALDHDSPLLPIIIKEMHSSTHEGCTKTLHRLRQGFFWKRMLHQVKDFIKNCEVCQKNKAENLLPTSLLQPLPTP